MLSPLLFYFKIFNNLREGYSFPNSQSAPVSVSKIFISFFPTFEILTRPARQ